MATLLLAEEVDGRLASSVAQALRAAVAIGEPVDLLIAGQNITAAAQAASLLQHVRRVRVADHAAYAHGLAEPLAALIVSLAGEYDAIVAGASSYTKNVMPRVAALLDVMQISDITAVVGPKTFERPIYAGNAIETVKSRDDKLVITIRTSVFSAIAEEGSAPIEPLTPVAYPALSRFVQEERVQSTRPELTGAKIVVAGGRALQTQENFKTYLEPLADRLGAAIGASRAAVDAGYAPNDWQIGQTGKVVAPDLYIAVGISGAIQHLAGMKNSRVIVAINKDEDAPIFQYADYGLVGDLFAILPALNEELAKPK